jgi:Leucine-rich repeat (LRR) protein/tRNA A-37 threonylcarbamoyl transferase component Bud32
MAELRRCPSRDELQQMVLGQLPDQTAQKIQLHLERCPRCCSALDECVASDEFLEALRTSGRPTAAPTKTMQVPIECIRGALSTWSRGYDRTQSGKSGRPFSMAEINRQLSPPQSDDELGRLGDFRVLRVLGVGGFAIVFEAEDIQLKRLVALKLMHPAIAATHGGTERFLLEAQSAAALKHEHVVTIYQVGMQGQTPFIALELLHGETLEDYLIRNGRSRVSEVVRIGREIASGLAAAHARGLLHRDIKPANIWLEGPETLERGSASIASRPAGKVKILDFGCAKSWADEVAISDQGLLIGTPAYMAPEQFSGDAVDPRTDLFSLGCILYRMAAGKRPFGGDNVFSVVRALAMEEPTPLATVNPEVPGPLSDLVDKLLSKSIDDRPATAQAVVDELRVIEQGLLVPKASEKAGAGRRTVVPPQRDRGTKWIIGAAVALALVFPLLCFLFGAQIIRFATNKGQVIIQVDDPAIAVTLTEDRIVIHDGPGQAEITLAAGEHQFEVTLKQPSGETRFKSEKFTLKRGGRKVLEVEKELATAPASQTPAEPKEPDRRLLGAITTDSKQRGANAPNLDRRCALWVLSLGGTVTVRAGRPPHAIEVAPAQDLPSSELELTSVQLEGIPLRQSDLAQLQGLSHLEELMLSRTETTDAGLEPLLNGEKLKNLNVDFTRVTDTSVARIKNRKGFRALSLRNTGVTDAGLENVEGMTSLERLMLDGTRVSNGGLVHIRHLTSLRALSLSFTSVTDTGLTEIEGLSGLEQLTLNATQLSDAGLIHLFPLKNLRRLVANRTHLSDEGLQHLAAWPHFEWLSVGETRVTDAGLVHLRGIGRMKFLGLNGLPITDAGLSNVQTLANLERLNLNATRVTDKGLVYLKGMTHLDSLDLGGTRITEAGLAELETLSNLRVLGLKGIGHLSDVAIPQLLHIKGLAEVDLRDTQVSAKTFSILQGMLPKARILWSEPNYSVASSVLSAGGTVGITLDEASAELAVKAIADLPRAPFRLVRARLRGSGQTIKKLLIEIGNPQLKTLASLDLSGTDIDDSDLERIKPLVGLHELNLAATHVTDKGLEALKGFISLRQLAFDGDAIQGSGLMHLQGLSELAELRLGCPALKELFLVELVPLRKLERLSLAKGSVTNEGANYLARLTHLKELDLTGTQITETGVARLKTELPQCRIIAK